MKPPSTHRNPATARKRIHFSGGSWWYDDPARGGTIRLDPMFEKCGWNVSVLCEMLGVGNRTFARVAEESLGITAKALLCRLRAVAACNLLREGGKITNLARQLGFPDDSNFTREFKRMVGVSPSFYMRSEQARAQIAPMDDEPR